MVPLPDGRTKNILSTGQQLQASFKCIIMIASMQDEFNAQCVQAMVHVTKACVYLTACSRNYFRCNMGLCVPVSTWCDGYMDCPDDSDELPGCNGSKCIYAFISLQQTCVSTYQFLQRDAMLARYQLSSCVCPSVCPSVHRSDTSWSCTKMAKPRITLRTAYDSSGTLVFRCQKSWRNSNDITPNGGAKQKWGRFTSALFDQYLAISQKRCKIGTHIG